jgi:hypothetical protein
LLSPETQKSSCDFLNDDPSLCDRCSFSRLTIPCSSVQLAHGDKCRRPDRAPHRKRGRCTAATISTGGARPPGKAPPPVYQSRWCPALRKARHYRVSQAAESCRDVMRPRSRLNHKTAFRRRCVIVSSALTCPAPCDNSAVNRSENRLTAGCPRTPKNNIRCMTLPCNVGACGYLIYPSFKPIIEDSGSRLVSEQNRYEWVRIPPGAPKQSRFVALPRWRRLLCCPRVAHNRQCHRALG